MNRIEDYIELYKMGGYIREMRKHVGHAPIQTCACGVIVENDKGEILLQRRQDNGCWGIKTKGAIRHIAFATDDVDGVIEKVKSAGYEVFIEPKDIVIPSDPAYPARMAFCYGPLGEEIEFFQER